MPFVSRTILARSVGRISGRSNCPEDSYCRLRLQRLPGVHFLDIHHGDRDAVGVRFIFPGEEDAVLDDQQIPQRQLRISRVLRPTVMFALFGATMESASIGVGPGKRGR